MSRNTEKVTQQWPVFSRGLCLPEVWILQINQRVTGVDNIRAASSTDKREKQKQRRQFQKRWNQSSSFLHFHSKTWIFKKTELFLELSINYLYHHTSWPAVCKRRTVDSRMTGKRLWRNWIIYLHNMHTVSHPALMLSAYNYTACDCLTCINTSKRRESKDNLYWSSILPVLHQQCALSVI